MKSFRFFDKLLILLIFKHNLFHELYLIFVDNHNNMEQNLPLGFQIEIYDVYKNKYLGTLKIM